MALFGRFGRRSRGGGESPVGREAPSLPGERATAASEPRLSAMEHSRGGGESAVGREAASFLTPTDRSSAATETRPPGDHNRESGDSAPSAQQAQPGGSVDPEPRGSLGFDAASPGAEAVRPPRAGGFPTQPREAAPEPRREVEPMPLCTRCGHANSEGSRFCSNCGNPLTAGVVPADPRTGERPAEMTSTMALGALGLGEQNDTGEIVSPYGTATEGLGETNALLVVQRGPNAGSRFLLDTDVTSAGRAPDSDIFLDDVTVSRRHAEFTRAAQGYLVRDVGSLNGTYVNRERIEEVLLADGDEVQIGKYRLVFLTGR